MFTEKDCNCQFCNSKATSKLLDGAELKLVECPLCGKYVFEIFNEDIENKNFISSYLFYNKKNDKNISFIGNNKNLKFLQNYYSGVTFFQITKEIIDSFRVMSFSEKINFLLLFLGNKSKYMGDCIQVSLNEFLSAAFVFRFNKKGSSFDDTDLSQQVSMIVEYLRNRELVDYCSDGNEYIYIILSIKGWQLIEQLQKSTSFGKKVFIAMSFAKGTESTREALKQGISNAGFTPVIIDEVTHNHQIVPEMFKQIRDSKFLVIDVSVPNNGAYYEAGYALGLGKEVIFCCNQNSFEDKENRPHFDVSQKQMIIWTDEADLAKKLTSWIKSLFE